MEKKGWQHSHVYTTENEKDKVPAFTSQSTRQNAVKKKCMCLRRHTLNEWKRFLTGSEWEGHSVLSGKNELCQKPGKQTMFIFSPPHLITHSVTRIGD